MNRNTSKMLLILGLIIPLVNPAQAVINLKKSDFEIANKNTETNLNKIKLNYTLEDSIEMLATINNENLIMPSNNSEVTISKTLPIKYNDLEKIIANNNPKISLMKSKVDQAKYLLIESISSWYPNINLSANGLPKYLQSNQYNASSADTSSKQLTGSASVEVSWNLIDPSRRPEIASAKDSYEKSKYNYLASIRDIQLEARNKFFLLQQSDEGVRIGKASVLASKQSLKDATSRFQSGLGTRLEVLEAKAQLSRDRQLLTKKLGEQMINRRSLAEILNLPEDTSPITASELAFVGSWNKSIEESIIAAYSYNEEIKTLVLDISINNSNANAALASSYPNLSIVNTISTSFYQGETFVDDPDLDKSGSTFGNTIGLNTTWKIFDGGKARALYKYNKKKAEESYLNLIKKRGEVRHEIETSFYNLKIAIEESKASKSEINASKEALRLARLRFNAGLTNQREIVNNQRDLTQAEERYSNAVTKYNTNLTELQRKTGINPVNSSMSQSNEY